MTTAVVVLGMHRSGTSAMAGALNIVGVDLGRRLYLAQKGVNEKGFWEHADVAEVHDSILRVIGSYWDDFLSFPEQWKQSPSLQRYTSTLKRLVDRDFSASRLWGIKDPRMCRLLPVWLPIFAECQVKPVFVLIARHPAEVCGSLHARDGVSMQKGLLLWLTYNLEAELGSRRFPRVFVTFDSLVEHPYDALEATERLVARPFPVPISEATAKIADFLTPSLRHHRHEGFAHVGKLEELATDMYRAFSLAAAGDSAFEARADALRVELDRVRENFDPLLVEQLRAVARERGRYEQLFLETYRSVSWKVTWPLRVVERRMRKGFPNSL
jgi:hypothetical protein